MHEHKHNDYKHIFTARLLTQFLYNTCNCSYSLHMYRLHRCITIVNILQENMKETSSEVMKVHEHGRSNTTTDGECVFSCTLRTLLKVHTIVIVIRAYDVHLRASKEKEQQLHSQLATIQQESQDKGQQLMKLENDVLSLKDKCKQQQEELERLHQQKGITETLSI